MLKDGDRVAAYAHQDDDNAWLLYGTFLAEESPAVKMDSGGELSMTDEWLERVQPVNDEVAQVIENADYWITLTVGNSEGEDELLATGITLPTGN